MRRVPLSSLLLLFASCTGGDDDFEPFPESAGAPARVDLVVGDAPVEELVAFSGTIEGLRLERSGGPSTDRLLPAPVDVEFLGLRDRFAWIASFELEAGDYDAVRLRFAPDSLAARDLDGRDVRVEVEDHLLLARFARPLTLGEGGYARVVVDLDLRSSLSGDVEDGVVDFLPSGTAWRVVGSRAVRLDGMDSVVTFRDTGTRSLRVAAMVGDARAVPLREVDVSVVDAPLLIGFANAVFDLPALYLTIFVPGLSVVEVDGFLERDGTLSARCVELEDQVGPQGQRYPVELEGIVVGRKGPSVLTLVVREISRGGSFAEPVLAGLGRATIDVLVDGAALLSSPDGELVPLADVRLGDQVEAKFLFFSAEPFQARRLVVAPAEGRVPGELRAREPRPWRPGAPR